MMERSIFQKSMKGMVKGKILKKLKSMKPPVQYLKPDRILHLSAADGFVESFQKISTFVTQSPQKLGRKIEELKSEKQCSSGKVEEPQAEVIDVAELMRDLEDAEDEIEVFEDKENVGTLGRNFCKDWILVDEQRPLEEIDASGFRRPDLDSGSLFDPKLLAAFEEAMRVQKIISKKAEEKLAEEIETQLDFLDEEPPLKLQKVELTEQVELSEEQPEIEDEEVDLLLEFEPKCPPGGSDAVILYSTSLRGIRKTFEDCQSIKFLLETFKVQFFERDVSMHSEYRDEMHLILKQKVPPPRLFIKGRYIGGADEVLKLHEQGRFRPLLAGIQIDETNGSCDGCGGMRFVMCFKCSGSHRFVANGKDGVWEKCKECNENGLIVCPYCS